MTIWDRLQITSWCAFTCVLTWWFPLAEILTSPPDLLPVLFPSFPLLISQVWPDGSQSILTEVSREVSASLSSFLSPQFGVCRWDTEHLMFSCCQLQPNIFLCIHWFFSFLIRLVEVKAYQYCLFFFFIFKHYF